MPTPPRKFSRSKVDPRDRFAPVSVLVADRDIRTAQLVQNVLISLGFGRIDMVTSSEEALGKLEDEPFDIVITEWNMEPINGVELVQAIRNAGEERRVRRDLPIIMLTSHAQKGVVENARDAGVTEFLAKPFTAASLASRLELIIDKPRSFVLAPHYKGPCRRRSGKPPEGVSDRRVRSKETQKGVEILPPNYTLRQRINDSATALLGETKIDTTQAALLKAGGELVDWAKDDIADLEAAYATLAARPSSSPAHLALLDVARAIATQAALYGYDLGRDVASMLADYLETHRKLDAGKLTVVRKHIDTISVVFREKIKETGQELGRDLVSSLRKLIKKLG